MCKSVAEGGQRCASHTGDAFKESETAVLMAQLSGDPRQISQAAQQWDHAAAEYASTPTGRAELDQRRVQYEQTRDLAAAAMFAAAIQRGDTLRAANTEAGRRIREHATRADAADAAAANDDEVLAAVYMDWQGDGPEPTSPYDNEGWLLDDDGQQWGFCNACGDERQPYEDCCDDGEIVPAQDA